MVANPSEALHDYVVPDIRTAAEIDGVVANLVVTGDLAHLYLRDFRNRPVKLLVQDTELAERLADHIQKNPIRVLADGNWRRTSTGWLPKYGACHARSFATLDMTSMVNLLDRFTNLACDSWNEHEDPIAAWKEWRDGE
jgi:hypothetical protein